MPEKNISPIKIYTQEEANIEEKLEFHAVQSDRYSFSNSIPDYSVEDGTTISDHVSNEPLQISFTGIISNFPILTENEQKIDVVSEKSNFVVEALKKKVAYLFNSQKMKLEKSYYKESRDKKKEAKNVIFELYKKGVLLSILTPDKVFTNMVINSYDFSGSPEALIVSLSFKEINVVNVKKIESTEDLEEVAGLEKNKGKVSKTESDENTKDTVQKDEDNKSKTEDEKKGEEAKSILDQWDPFGINE